MLLSHSRCSRVEGRNSMKPKISVAWRRKREMLRQAESSGMAFQLDVLKGSLQNVLDTYNDNVQSARQLDDKAQKTGAFAGIFVAASFGYLKPNDISSLMNAAGQGAEIVLFLALMFFVSCVASCLAVMWARRMPAPLDPEVIQMINDDVLRATPSEISGEFQKTYIRTQLTMWMPIIDTQIAINRSKGRRLLTAQIFLGIGMICVTALILRIVHPDFKVYLR